MSTKMADRRKMTQSAPDNNQDTDKQFLEKNNVYGMMKDLLAKIIANRPNDPMKFIANYFDTLSVEDQSENLINRAVQVLSMTHHSRPVFEANIQSAFDILGKYKINKRLQGINGTVLSLLLHALCKNMPSVVVIRLFKRLECFEYEAVTYDVFRSSVFTCCVLLEYVTIADKLFHTLDIKKSGKADKNLCESALEQLRTALGSSRTDVKRNQLVLVLLSNSIANLLDKKHHQLMRNQLVLVLLSNSIANLLDKKPHQLMRILESSYSLSTDGLYTALDKAMSKTYIQGVYTQDQFVIEACDCFLQKVKRLK